MSSIVPTIGRIVWYALAAHDVTAIASQRARTGDHGNPLVIGEEYPAIVVRVFGDTPDCCVNLKVELDGPDSHWVTSRVVGDQPGNYRWMPYQIGQAAKHVAEAPASIGGAS